MNADGDGVAALFEVTTCSLARSCVLMETDTVESLSQSDTQWPFLFATLGRMRVRFMSTSTCLLFAACIDLEIAPQHRHAEHFSASVFRPVIFSQGH